MPGGGAELGEMGRVGMGWGGAVWKWVGTRYDGVGWVMIGTVGNGMGWDMMGGIIGYGMG